MFYLSSRPPTPWSMLFLYLVIRHGWLERLSMSASTKTTLIRGWGPRWQVKRPNLVLFAIFGGVFAPPLPSKSKKSPCIDFPEIWKSPSISSSGMLLVFFCTDSQFYLITNKKYSAFKSNVLINQWVNKNWTNKLAGWLVVVKHTILKSLYHSQFLRYSPQIFQEYCFRCI